MPYSLSPTSPPGTTLNSSWPYCYDHAGNLTSQGVDPGCPRGTTYTVNDAQQITAKNGSSANWSCDELGNETAGASTPEGTRTGETWSDYSQMTSITVGGQTYAGRYGLGKALPSVCVPGSRPTGSGG